MNEWIMESGLEVGVLRRERVRASLRRPQPETARSPLWPKVIHPQPLGLKKGES
jgi:hypothetical protein